MRKFPVIIAIFLIFQSAFAADPAFYGNLISAQQEKNPRIRAGLIVSAIENSTQPESDAIVLQILTHDFSSGGFDRILLQRLVKALKNRPDDRNLLFFLSGHIYSLKDITPDYFDGAVKCLKKINFTRLHSGEYDIAYKTLFDIMRFLLFSGRNKEGVELLQELRSGHPESPLLIQAETYLYTNLCFREHLTAPHLKDYDKLPENDLWKKHLDRIAKQISEIVPANSKAAENLLRCMLTLNMPQSVAALKKFYLQFPESQWHDLSARIALQHNQKDLFVPSDSLYHNFIGYLKCRNFRAAKRLLKHFNKQARFELTLMLCSVQEKHDDVIKMLYSGEVPLTKIYPGIFRFSAHSLYMQKELPLLNTLLQHFSQKLDKELVDPDVCNSLGYVAACLNTQLENAEKLIRIAVKLYPDTDSYRDSLAWVLFRQGKFADAEKEIELAIRCREVSAGVSTLFLHAAEIKLALNKTAEAKKYLDWAKKLYDPSRPESQEYDLQTQQRLEKLLQ